VGEYPRAVYWTPGEQRDVELSEQQVAELPSWLEPVKDPPKPAKEGKRSRS